MHVQFDKTYGLKVMTRNTFHDDPRPALRRLNVLVDIYLVYREAVSIAPPDRI